jgi:hypothetical protein
MPFAAFAESNFLLMEDNAGPHVARQVIDYLNAVDIPFMEWLPNCPDLNPIDHPWCEVVHLHPSITFNW